MKNKFLYLYKELSSRLPGGYALNPLDINFRITTLCNLNCSMCVQEKTGEMPLPRVRGIIDALDRGYRPGLRPTIMFIGGEPLLHPGFREIIDHASRRGFPFSVCSNGTLFDKDLIKFLLDRGIKEAIFSIDGTEESHDALRGQGVFSKAARHLRSFCSLDQRSAVTKRINTLLFKGKRNISSLVKFFSDLDVEHLFVPVLTNGLDAGSIERLSPGLEEFELARQECAVLAAQYGKRIVLRKSKRLIDLDPADSARPRCRALDWRLNIKENGTASPCRRWEYADVGDDPIRWSYASQEIRLLRQRIRKCGSLDDCGDCCRLTKNYVFEGAKCG